MSLQTFETSSAAFPPQPLHLLEEINHRVANEYAEAIATLRLAAADAENAQVGAAIGGLAKRLRAYAEAHRALLAPAADGQVDLADYVGNVCASMTRASLGPHGVGLLVDADEIWLDAGRAGGRPRRGRCRSPGRSPSRGHAARRCGSVRRRSARHARPGRGCRLVETLAAELGGSIDWWFTPAGCHARLEVPTMVAPAR